MGWFQLKYEDKREKFVRLAESRTNKVLKEVSLIGNLANRSNYDYNSSDVEKILKALKKSISELENKFSSNTKKEFKL